MLNFFHKLFNPHCSHCRDERIEARHCESCDTLREEVTRLRYENELLLHKLIDKPIDEPKAPSEEVLKPIGTRPMTWRMKQQQLQNEDRILADRLKKEAKEREENKEVDTSDFEKELKEAENRRLNNAS